VKSAERFRAKRKVPKISRKNVEETYRWEDRARKRFLNLDVMVHNGKVRGKTRMDETVNISAIKMFVEADAGKTGLRMKELHSMQEGSGIRKKRRRQPQKNSCNKNKASADNTPAPTGRP